MSASMKGRYLGHSQLLSKAVAAMMAEMEVSPQEEMANPQGMKVFAVERPGLFSCSVWSAIVATRIRITLDVLYKLSQNRHNYLIL